VASEVRLPAARTSAAAAERKPFTETAAASPMPIAMYVGPDAAGTTSVWLALPSNP
jgi:hypothetical protein